MCKLLGATVIGNCIYCAHGRPASKVRASGIGSFENKVGVGPAIEVVQEVVRGFLKPPMEVLKILLGDPSLEILPFAQRPARRCKVWTTTGNGDTTTIKTKRKCYLFQHISPICFSGS